jgi:hypothetical protein
LSAAQHRSTDVSTWLHWFALALGQACVAASALLDAALEKSRFWATHSQLTLNERRRKVIQRLLDEVDGGFLGGLPTLTDPRFCRPGRMLSCDFRRAATYLIDLSPPAT